MRLDILYLTPLFMYSVIHI